jgi:uncharacterized membrane protein YebE (DUF533 family)
MDWYYSQKNAQTQQTSHSSPASSQSRYIPSEVQQPLTYSPASISQKRFEQVVSEENNESGQMIILRAMITAANADGHIDENERQRIYQQVDNLQLSVEDKAGLFGELRSPLFLQALIEAVPNSETAIEVYAASVLAIDERQETSMDYLNRLASSMLIPRELVNAVHTQADALRSE